MASEAVQLPHLLLPVRHCYHTVTCAGSLWHSQVWYCSYQRSNGVWSYIKKMIFLPNGRHLTVNYRSSFFDPLRGCHGNQFGGKSPNDFDLLHWHSKCRNIAIWMSGFIEPINTLHKNLVNVGPVVPQITRGQILTFRMTGKNWYIHPNVSKFAGLIFTNFQWWWTRGWEWLIWHSWMLDMLLWHATC